jgi:hypothetical protein
MTMELKHRPCASRSFAPKVQSSFLRRLRSCSSSERRDSHFLKNEAWVGLRWEVLSLNMSAIGEFSSTSLPKALTTLE